MFMNYSDQVPYGFPMLCQKCQHHPATIHIQEIVGGGKRALHLCGACAAAQGIDAASTLKGLDLAKLLLHLAQEQQVQAKAAAAGAATKPRRNRGELAEEARPCPGCGITAEEVRSTGRLGCPECYHTFSPLLRPLLKDMHRGLRHTGKPPGAGAGAEAWTRRMARRRIETALATAVKAEDYEKAAGLRDRLREANAAAGDTP